MAVILLRTVLMYGVILLAVRLMGKRQVSQLQNSELVVTLLLSELAVLPIQEEEKSLWVGLAPMAALVACELLVSVLMLKSGRFRQLVCGSPTVVIERGQVLQKAMRRLNEKYCPDHLDCPAYERTMRGMPAVVMLRLRVDALCGKANRGMV